MSRLARRTAGTRMTVLSFHPGFVRSNLGADGPWWWRALGPAWRAFASPTCSVAVSAASDASLNEANGALIDPSLRVHRFDDLDAALATALAAGAVREGGVREAAWGRIVQIADPFGHGWCLLQFLGNGYDEITT